MVHPKAIGSNPCVVLKINGGNMNKQYLCIGGVADGEMHEAPNGYTQIRARPRPLNIARVGIGSPTDTLPADKVSEYKFLTWEVDSGEPIIVLQDVAITPRHAILRLIQHYKSRRANVVLNAVRVSDLLIALKSGQYRKGDIYLRTFDNLYSVFGLMCQLYDKSKYFNDTPTSTFQCYRADGGNSYESGCPLEVRDYYGFTDEQLAMIQEWNNSSLSFRDIYYKMRGFIS